METAEHKSTPKHFFRWEKKIISSYRWKKLSYGAKAVFPVIAVHCGKSGMAWPGFKKIAELAGVNKYEVQNFVEELERILKGSFKIKKTTTKRNKLYWKYQIKQPPRQNSSDYFPFFKESIIISGLWAGLSYKAKAVYPVLRFLGYFDPEAYCKIEEIDIDLDDEQAIKVIYRNRKYDFVDINDEYSIKSLCLHDLYDIYESFAELRKVGLLYTNYPEATARIYEQPFPVDDDSEEDLESAEVSEVFDEADLPF